MTASFQQVVGLNVRRLRLEHNLRQDDLAKWCRHFGLRWTASRIGELENGRLGISAAALVVLVGSFGRAIEGELTLAEFVKGSSGVQLSDLLEVENDWLEAVFAGESLEGFDSLGATSWSGNPTRFALDSQGNLGAAIGETDAITGELLAAERALRPDAFLEDVATVRASRRVGMIPAEFAGIAQELFGRSFVEERDLRAGQDASAQKRGSVTRELVKLIQDEWLARDYG